MVVIAAIIQVAMTALLLLGGAVAACAVRTPAAPDRAFMPQAPPPIEWPARWTEDLQTVTQALPDSYWHRMSKLDDVQWDDDLYERHVIDVVYTTVRSMGIVRHTRLAWCDDQRRIGLQFMSWQDRPDDNWIRDDSDRAYWRKATGNATLTMPDGTVRGLVVTLGPHTTRPWALRTRLSERGWAVLHLGMTAPHGASSRLNFEFDRDISTDEAGAAIATEIDEMIAEYAYTAEAAASYVREHVPELIDAPLAVLGVSRGALIAPAAAARLGDQVDSVILITGGANLLDIAQRTSFADHGLLTIKWKEGRSRTAGERTRVVKEAYLRASQLDPYHMALHLRSPRVLVVDAAFDAIVPASSGQLLYERLGRPERWRYRLGHVATFWLVDRNPDRIIDWLEANQDTPTH